MPAYLWRSSRSWGAAWARACDDADPVDGDGQQDRPDGDDEQQDGEQPGARGAGAQTERACDVVGGREDRGDGVGDGGQQGRQESGMGELLGSARP